MIVLDASAAVDLLLVHGRHEGIRGLVERHEAFSSELLVPEVLHVFRRFALRGELPSRRADQAVQDLCDLPVELYPVRPFTAAVWGCRGDLTSYDATYVVLAKELGASLVTTDQRLARTARRQCTIAELPDPG